MSQRQSSLFVSPGVAIALILLLLNDFTLKSQFHNWVTGKLSDFAGLFAFSLFWMAFFPQSKRWVCILTGVWFVFWKSVYSQPLIEAWNTLACF